MAGQELRGVALQIAERVFSRAAPGEVVVSSTVKDLVAGAGLQFEELESQVLTGPSAGWRLHRVVAASAPSSTERVELENHLHPPTSGVLSHREREVALLVTRGHSNRQIADELVIAPATVERHVANILRKMEFRSRAQIAAWIVEHNVLRDE